MKVTPKPKERIDSLVRRFKKICEKDGLIKEIKKHSAYESPSEKRRRSNVKRERQAVKDKLALRAQGRQRGDS